MGPNFCIATPPTFIDKFQKFLWLEGMTATPWSPCVLYFWTSLKWTPPINKQLRLVTRVSAQGGLTVFYEQSRTCGPSITSPGDVKNCWSTSAGFSIPEPIVTRNWLVCGLHIHAACRFSVSVCLLLTHSPSGVGGADGGLGFWGILISSKLVGLASDGSGFCVTFNGSSKTWEVWLGIGASGGMASSGCDGCESACNASWLFSSRGSKGGWEGSSTDCISESGSDSKGTSGIGGTVWWITCENGSFEVGATMESKKLCPSISPLVTAVAENKSLRVRFTLSAGTPWTSTLWTESSGSLVCLDFVGLGCGELSFIHWPSEKQRNN